MAGQQHSPEPVGQVQVLDPRADRPDAGWQQSEHRGGFVDAHDAVAQGGQRCSDTPEATSEVEHGGAGGHGGVDDLRLAVRREPAVDLHRAAVRGDHTWPAAGTCGSDVIPRDSLIPRTSLIAGGDGGGVIGRAGRG
jgi:hypothetical protein